MGGWVHGWGLQNLITDLDMRNSYNVDVQVLSSRGWARGNTRGGYRIKKLMK
jgi:hypothetical protein